MLARRSVAWAVLALLFGSGAVAEAATRSARLRWAPSESPDTVGYHVWVRTDVTAYDTPIDVGLPALGGDGTLDYTVAGLDEDITWLFAVSAYAADASESPRSNEVTLAPAGASTSTTTTSTSSTTSTTVVGAACDTDADCTDTDACTEHERCEAGRCASEPITCPAAENACTVARCDAAAGCVTDPLPDDSTCESSDPCVPSVCTAGTCVEPAVGLPRGRDEHSLAVSRFVLRAAGRRRRLVARAAFALRGGIDPTVEGGTIEIRTAAGAVLYRALVPGPTFRANRRHRVFRYRVAPGRRAPAEANGLAKLVVTTRGATADVVVAGASSDLEIAADEPTLQWVLRLGEQCTRALDLDCRAAGPATRCR